MRLIHYAVYLIAVLISTNAVGAIPATVTDRQGNVHEIDIEVIQTYNSPDRHHINVRRGSADVHVRLLNIRELNFDTGRDPERHRAMVDITTVEGETVSVMITTSSRSGALNPDRQRKVRGIDRAFGTPIEIELRNISKIELHHDGIYRRCKTTGETFLRPDYRFSPYTGERLEDLPSYP